MNLTDLTVNVFQNDGICVGSGYVTDVTIEYRGYPEGGTLTKINAVIKNFNQRTMYDKYGCNSIEIVSQCGAATYINQPTIMKDSIFYMNWMEGSGAPTHAFTDKADAEKEAARLAHAHQRSVYTLQAIARTEPQVNVTKTELKEKALDAAKAE